MSTPPVDLRPGFERPIESQPDPAREHGVEMFEATRGNVDASVETQLRKIEQGLTCRLERL
jgi:flagellar biosynthesis/type III secretory pathway protein FliH